MIRELRKYGLLLAIVYLCLAVSPVLTQDRDTYEVGGNETTNSQYYKNIFFDLGYGARGLSFGAGFRWWVFSAGIGLTGILDKSANAQGWSNAYGIPYPANGSSVYETEKFPSATVSLDLSYYYDYEEFSPFITLGYYVQSDSVFAKYTGEVYQYQGVRFPIGSENKTGLAFGIGCQYYPWESVNVALGYHNKKGVFAQIGYFWK